MPADYFDLILSVSVIEHVPLENLNNFYGDIMRIIKKPILANGEGRIIHTIDIPYTSNLGHALPQIKSAKQAGFTVPPRPQLFSAPQCPLFEPLETQYIYSSGKIGICGTKR